jgi:hypothetical protein
VCCSRKACLGLRTAKQKHRPRHECTKERGARLETGSSCICQHAMSENDHLKCQSQNVGDLRLSLRLCLFSELRRSQNARLRQNVQKRPIQCELLFDATEAVRSGYDENQLEFAGHKFVSDQNGPRSPASRSAFAETVRRTCVAIPCPSRGCLTRDFK